MVPLNDDVWRLMHGAPALTLKIERPDGTKDDVEVSKVVRQTGFWHIIGCLQKNSVPRLVGWKIYENRKGILLREGQWHLHYLLAVESEFVKPLSKLLLESESEQLQTRGWRLRELDWELVDDKFLPSIASVRPGFRVGGSERIEFEL